MSEQRKEPMTTKRKLSVFAILVVYTIAVMIGTRMIWPSEVIRVAYPYLEGQIDAVPWSILTCPPRPSRKTDFAIDSHYEETGRITFNATEDMAADTEEWGWLSYDMVDDKYSLYVDSRYEFQEVLDYLESWGECSHDQDIYINGGIEIDVDSTLWIDMDYIGSLEIEGHDQILITGPLESIVMEGPLVIQAAPTPTPDLSITEIESPHDLADLLVELESEPYDKFWLTGQFTFLPPSADTVLLIDWPHTIHITDALPQTTSLQGPATVTFEEEE